MAQSVVVKKAEKVKKVFEVLGADCSEQDFILKFKELYPKDWDRINQVYEEHETRDKKGKGHPMPHPDRYMKSMYKVGKEKL